MEYISKNKVFSHVFNDTFTPVTCEVHLTNKCNNNCYYCGQSDKKNNTTMTPANLSKSFELASHYNVRGMYFSGGGEPTIYSHFDSLQANIESFPQIEYGLITNGLKLSYDWRFMLLNNFTWVRISIDTAFEDEYKTIRGVNIHKVINNIHLLLMEKEIKNNTSLTVGLQIVVNQYNYNTLSKSVKKLFDMFPKISYISIRPIETFIEDYPYSEKELKTIKKELKKIKTRCKNVLISDKWNKFFYNPDRDFGFSKCYAQKFLYTVTASGNIYPCCHVTHKDKYLIGNVADMDVCFSHNQKKMIKTLPNCGFNPKICPFGCRGESINVAIESHMDIDHKNFL